MDWIIQYYLHPPGTTSVPLVNTRPLELHIDRNVKPVIFHKVGQICQAGGPEEGVIQHLSHWVQQVCCLNKKSGKPRRTIDFKAVNMVATRQTHAVKTLFYQVGMIPKNSRRTCMDAWEGDHITPSSLPGLFGHDLTITCSLPGHDLAITWPYSGQDLAMI